jgi:hypothetical protein
MCDFIGRHSIGQRRFDMGIHIGRVFVKKVGGKIPRRTLSNLQYVLVIEAQADKALATRSVGGLPEPYRLFCRAVDLTEGGDSPAPMSFNVLEQFDNTYGWIDTGESLEAQKEYLIGHTDAPISSDLKYHLFKCYVTLYTLIPPTDADGAESDVFLLT